MVLLVRSCLSPIALEWPDAVIVPPAEMLRVIDTSPLASSNTASESVLPLPSSISPAASTLPLQSTVSALERALSNVPLPTITA